MTTEVEVLINRAKAGENNAIHSQLSNKASWQLIYICEKLLQRIVKDEIELDQLIEEVDRNNRELSKHINEK